MAQYQSPIGPSTGPSDEKGRYPGYYGSGEPTLRRHPRCDVDAAFKLNSSIPKNASPYPRGDRPGSE